MPHFPREAGSSPARCRTSWKEVTLIALPAGAVSLGFLGSLDSSPYRPILFVCPRCVKQVRHRCSIQLYRVALASLGPLNDVSPRSFILAVHRRVSKALRLPRSIEFAQLPRLPAHALLLVSPSRQRGPLAPSLDSTRQGPSPSWAH